MTSCNFFSNVFLFFSLQFNGRKKLCLFKEGFSQDHYTVIQSVHNHTWYVGFNRKGKALKGSMYSKPKLRNCFHFVKREHNFGLQDTPRPGPKIKDPSKLKDLLTGRGPFRHRRIVPTTPPPRWTKWMISCGLVASLSCSCWVFLFFELLGHEAGPRVLRTSFRFLPPIPTDCWGAANEGSANTNRLASKPRVQCIRSSVLFINWL